MFGGLNGREVWRKVKAGTDSAKIVNQFIREDQRKNRYKGEGG